MDITQADLFWFHDRVDGTPLGNPYSFETWVAGSEIDSVQVTPPGGSPINLTSGSPGEFYHDPASSYASFAALTADYPGHATTPWRFDFFSVNGASEDDFVEIVLNPSEVPDFIGILNPTHNGTMPVSPTITWSDCSACGGNAIVAGLIDGFDNDVDFFVTDDLGATSWSPIFPLNAGDPYEVEVIIGDYSHHAGYLGSPQWTTDGGDAFNFVAGFESINRVDATAVPEPSTALLVGLGLLGLAARNRGRRRLEP